MFHISSHYIGVSFSHFWTHQISVGYMVHKKWGQIFQSLDGFRSIHLWGGSNHWPIFTHIPRILQDSLDICGPLSGLQFKWTKWIYFTIIVGVNDLDYIGVKSSLISLLYTSIRAFLSQVSQFLARKKSHNHWLNRRNHQPLVTGRRPGESGKLLQAEAFDGKQKSGISDESLGIPRKAMYYRFCWLSLFYFNDCIGYFTGFRQHNL